MMGRKLGVGMASKVMAEVGNEFIAKEFDNMTKQVHILADETLGGIMREYEETNHGYGGVVSLRPTNIVHIDGVRYRQVDRKAKVGERVIVVNEAFPEEYYEPGYTNGDIFTAKCVDIDDVLALKGTDIRLYHSEYRVLVPVEEEFETSPQSIEDLIANLATRMTALERSVTALDDKHEAHAKQLADIGRSTWYLEDDVKYAKDARYQLAVEIRDIKARLEATSNALRKGD